MRFADLIEAPLGLVAIVQADAELLALGVDRVIHASEVIVHPLPAAAGYVTTLAGAVFDAHGNPQLVLNPEALLEASNSGPARSADPGPTPHILVIDDSLTSPVLLQSFLEAGGFKVDLAVSGEDAMAKARARAAVKMVARIKAIHRSSINRRSRLAPAAARVPQAVRLPARDSDEAVVVVIGASIGGPSAVAKILSQIAADFPLSILLVTHIAPEFSDSLVQWIAKASALNVRVARDGDPMRRPGRGEVLMAPPDRHLTASQGRVRVTDTLPRHLCRPSIDELFESVGRECGPQAIAWPLTGMSKDGAVGLLAVRQNGGQTIAQDEASSVVFGMPREAIALDAAQVISRLADVAGTLCRMVRRHSGDGI